MNEPVSMFDLGLYKLECDMNEFFANIAANPCDVETEVQTGYIPNTNKIVILIQARTKKTVIDKESAKRICEDRYWRINLRLDKYFRKRYESYNPEDGLREELEQITVIEITVANYDNPFQPLAHSRNMYKEKIHFVQD
jgi:hypothetical protein